MSFSVCVLCYGDHPHLAARCLNSIARSADWALIDSIQVGLNAVSPATRTVVDRAAASWPVPWRILEPADGANVGKYPLMRRMFYGPPEAAGIAIPRRVLKASRVMWFDDDSYVRDESGPEWWRQVRAAATDVTVLGSLYKVAGTPTLSAAIADQDWYTATPRRAADPVAADRAGSPVHTFVTGGWWVARSRFLRIWDYPFLALHHNGGDVLLGELCAQQKQKLGGFNAGVAINADAQGRESRAPRRGRSEVPAGRSPTFDWTGTAHHDFTVRIRTGGPLREAS